MFLLSEKSLRMRSSSCSHDKAGFKSITRRRCFFLMALAQKELALKSTGPLTPKWVNSISPNSRYSSLFPSYTAASTFLSERPAAP